MIIFFLFFFFTSLLVPTLVSSRHVLFGHLFQASRLSVITMICIFLPRTSCFPHLIDCHHILPFTCTLFFLVLIHSYRIITYVELSLGYSLPFPVHYLLLLPKRFFYYICMHPTTSISYCSHSFFSVPFLSFAQLFYISHKFL